MSRQIKFGIILQYVQMAFSILIGVLYTPLILKMLGQSEYGLYNLASSIIAYLSILSLGFGSSYIRFYTLKKKQNPDSVAQLNGLYLIAFSIIGMVVFFIGLFLSTNVGIFLNNSYSPKDFDIAKKLMVLLAFNLGISFPVSLFTSYITAQEKFIFLKLLNIGKTVLSPGLSIIALFFNFGSVGIVLATTIISLIVDVVNIIYCFKKIKMKFSFKKIEFILLKDIFIFSIFIAINQLIDQINWQTDKIILGKMMTSAAVSIYAIGALLNNYFILFSTAISSVYAPRINRIVSKGGKECDIELTKLMTSVGRIQFFVLALVLLGFIFFGKYFISIWAGSGYEISYFVALLLMVPEIVPLIQNTGIEIQRAKNKHQFRSILYLIIAITNVGISILLCYLFGVIGVVLGTTISLIIGNIIIMNIYYHKKLNLNMIYFWKRIFYIIPSLIIPIIIGLISVNFIPINNIVDFLRQIVYFVAIYVLFIYLFGLNRNEKESLQKFLKR